MSRTQSFVLFFIIVFSLFALMQFYLYRTYRSWTHKAYPGERQRVWQRSGLITLLAGNFFFLAQISVRSLDWYSRPLVQLGVIYPAGIFLASIIFGFLLIAMRDLLRLIFFWTQRASQLFVRLRHADSTSPDPTPVRPVDESRRQFLKLTGLATIGASFGTPFFGSLATAHQYRVTRVPLKFTNLPSGLDGLTIAQVSDVHAGIYMTERDIVSIVELVNGLRANVVVLTGDHVDSDDSQIPSVHNTMGLLKSDYGVFGCLGNHDHFATAEKVTAALEQKSIVMLDNAHRTIDINGERLSLVGVDDAGGGSRNFARLDEATAGLDPESFKILLSHRPDFFDKAKRAGLDLTLSGHTHGGQVGVEFWGIKLNPVYLVHKYPMGHFTDEGKQLYVNVGVGMVGAPIRFVPPEISLFTLHRA